MSTRFLGIRASDDFVHRRRGWRRSIETERNDVSSPSNMKCAYPESRWHVIDIWVSDYSIGIPVYLFFINK